MRHQVLEDIKAVVPKLITLKPYIPGYARRQQLIRIMRELYELIDLAGNSTLTDDERYMYRNYVKTLTDQQVSELFYSFKNITIRTVSQEEYLMLVEMSLSARGIQL
jgi:hypothetical protein